MFDINPAIELIITVLPLDVYISFFIAFSILNILTCFLQFFFIECSNIFIVDVINITCQWQSIFYVFDHKDCYQFSVYPFFKIFLFFGILKWPTTLNFSTIISTIIIGIHTWLKISRFCCFTICFVVFVNYFI